MKTLKRQFGDWGERLAITELQDRQYEIITQNYNTKGGELDIIAWHKKVHHGKTLCFIEVKTRSGGVGTAERAVDYKKLAHMQRAAREFCKDRKINITKTPIQFESVCIYVNEDSEPEVYLYTIPVS